MAELAPLDAVRLSTYNPRNTDPARLELIELSLRKVGWLFPIYATRSGEVLSGHQRHLVATRMGLDEIPVEWLDDLPLEERKAVNILFNRATNEMRASTTTGALAGELRDEAPAEVAAKLSDVSDPYPCLNIVERPIEELLEAIGVERNEYGTAVSRQLGRRTGVAMPVVLTPKDEVLNGLGRLRHYQRSGRKTVPTVVVPARRAKLAGLLVNKLSMDFDINERYADLLRYNSFRRSHHRRQRLGRGFVTELGARNAKDFDILDRRDRQRWVAAYGESVVDFGAGLLVETELLRRAGVRVSPFEPYVSGDDGEVSTDRTREVVGEFLEDVAGGVRWSSVFISSVLNSVPFAEDRGHIATILAALAWPDARLYAFTRSDKHTHWEHVQGREFHNNQSVGSGRFALDYEAGIAVAGFHDSRPKVQKHYAPPELRALFAPHFEHVDVSDGAGGMLLARGREPRKPSPRQLDAAINFEFNLPMPDGQRLGLAKDARVAFRARFDAVRANG